MLTEYSFDNIYFRHAVDDDPIDNLFTMHIHDRCEIYFFVSGNVEYLVEGSSYPLEENSMMIMRPAEVHKPRILQKCHYERYAINFPLDFAADTDPEHRLMKPFLDRDLGKWNRYDASAIDINLIHTLCSELFQESLDDYDRRLTLNTNLLMILRLISRAFEQRNELETKPRSTSERIVAYVNSHLFETLSVPELAQHFFLSPSQFNRIFRQATGASPWEYITKKRLTAAKEKIRSGSLAQEAAENCGFKDYSSFYRAYMKNFGSAPTGK